MILDNGILFWGPPCICIKFALVEIKLLPVCKIALNFMRNELSNVVGLQNVWLSCGWTLT